MGCLKWTRLRQSSTTHVCWHSPSKTFPLNSNHHHFHPQLSPHSMSFGLISSRFSHQIKPLPFNQLEKSTVADHTDFWGQEKQSTCDFNNLAKSTISLYFAFCFFVFFLEDEWKVNFWGSVNRIMKTKTKVLIKPLIAWQLVQRKKDNTREKFFCFVGLQI